MSSKSNCSSIKLPKVAVLLAAHNGGEWIEEQLLTIINQHNVELTVFVSIDNSTDKTENIIKNMMKKYENICIVNNQIKFGSAAANFLYTLQYFDLSGFSYISLSDQDDIWMLDKLTMAIQNIVKTDSDCYSSDLISFDNDKHHSFFLEKDNAKKSLDYMFQGASAGCTYVLTQKAASLVQKKISGLSIDYFKPMSHDWLIYAICRSHGFHWYHDQNSYIFYRQHSNNVFGALPGILGLMFRLKLSRTGWYRDHILKMKTVLACNKEEVEVINSLDRFHMTDRLSLMLKSHRFRRRSRDCFLLIFLIFFKLI